MFILVNPVEKISEREKHLRTSALRSHTASFAHDKRKRAGISYWRRKIKDEAENRAVQTAANILLPSLTSRPRSSAILALHNQHDIQGVQYFLECGLPHISGLDDGIFWHRNVPLLVNLNSSLQYAIAALGTALRARQLRCLVKSTTRNAGDGIRLLEISNKAFKQLIAQDDMTPLTLMTACVMFSTIGWLTNDFSLATKHLDHGLAILQEHLACRGKRTNHWEDIAIETALLPMFKRVLVSAGSTQYVTDSSIESVLMTTRNSTAIERTPLIRPNPSNLEGLNSLLPDSFSSVFMSGGWLRKLASAFTDQFKRPTNASFVETCRMESTRLRAKASLQAWRCRFETFMVTNNNQLDTTASSMAKQQDAYFHYIYIQLETMFAENEMVFDLYEASFQAINTSCHAHLALITKKHGTGSRRLIYRSDSYILPLLSFTAHRCRHPLIRRQAVELMEKYDLVEAFTPSDNFAAMARVLINIEERDCHRPPQTSADIIGCQRVRSIDMTYNPPRSTRYSRPETQRHTTDAWLVDDGQGQMVIRLNGRLIQCSPHIIWRNFAGDFLELKAYSAMIYSAGEFPQQPDVLARAVNLKTYRARWRRYPYTSESDIESHVFALEKTEDQAGPTSLMGYRHRFDEMGNFDLSLGRVTNFRYSEDGS